MPTNTQDIGGGMMKCAILIFSGGLDSTTILLDLLDKGEVAPYCVLFNYGQKHNVELRYAVDVLSKLQIPYEVIKLPKLKMEEDSYIVEGRNLIFLTYAYCIAMREGAEEIYAGFCEGDNSGFPDCRESFIKEAEKVLNLGYGGDVNIRTPLIGTSKKETFLRNWERGDFQFIVENTLTCYNGVEVLHTWGRGCGICPSCLARKEGFELMKKEVWS